MNQRQRAFCEAYLVSGNAAEAAREAGYSARTAQVEEIRQFWTATMRDDTAKSADRLKASELLAKTYGAFLERVAVDAEVTTQEAMAGLTEEELRALAQLDGEEWE